MIGQGVPKRAVLIAGPTTSGKSALALALAERLGGAIINADSMQVYRDLRIITARPTPADEARAPHALYGHVEAAENYSAGRWRAEAGAALAAAEQAGRLPIIVGGTGLYFKALLFGLAPVPAIPRHVRAAMQERLQTEGIAALHAELEERDARTARRLAPGDRARITRALEVLIATGRSLSEWHGELMQPELTSDQAIRIFLEVPQAELYRRIDQRFEDMLASGALEEVSALALRGIDPAFPAMKAHGVPWLIRHLNGELDLAQAAAEGKRDTRRYTKRQRTWFRNQLPDWTWVAPEKAPETILSGLGRARAGL